MRADKKTPLKSDKKAAARSHKRGVVGYSKKTALLEDAITQMNAGKYGRSSAALKELLALDPHNMEARRLFATLHLRLGSLIPARQAFDSLINEALERQDYWLAESLLREYLAAGPRCVPFLEKLGTVYLEKGDTLEAVTEYGKAIDILIEDPDPDNPNHASQLFAKIRELAPASPIAFRLASCFDAQTGELIARPQAHHGEPAVPESSSSQVEEVPALPPIPEAAAGPGPREPIEGSLGEQGMAPIEESASPSNSAVAVESTGQSPPTGLSGSDSPLFSSEPSVSEREHSGPEAQGAIPQLEAAPVADPVKGLAAEPAPDSMPDLLDGATSSVVDSAEASHAAAADSIGEVPATPQVQDSAYDIEGEALSSSTLLFKEQDQPLSPIQRPTVGEVVPAPMPWEDVHESTIDIPDHVPEVPAAQPQDVPGASLPEPESVALVQEEASEPVSPVSAAPEPAPNVEALEEPLAAPPAPATDQKSAGSFQEPTKSVGSLWESLFNTAWKFGDKHPVDVSQIQPEQAAANQSEAPASISSGHVQASESESFEIPAADRERSASDSSDGPAVAQPMPWDQVLESSITIPPSQADEPVVEAAGESSILSVSPVEPVPALHGAPEPEETSPQSLDVPASAPSVTDEFSLVQAASAPLPSEPEFRLVAPDPVQSVTETQSDRVEPEPSSYKATQTVASPISIEPEPPPFTLAVSVSVPETASTAPEVSEETIEPFQPSPPSLSASAQAPSGGAARTASHPETVFPSFKEQIAEPPPVSAPETPQGVQSAGLSEPGVSLVAPPAQAGGSPEAPTESAQTPATSMGAPSHWKTGEVAVQVHRPSSKKKKRAPQPEPEQPVASLSSEETDSRPFEENEQQEAAPVEAKAPIPEPAVQKEDWVRTGESIRFIGEPKAPPVTEPVFQASGQIEPIVAQPLSPAAAAVDVLFESSGQRIRSAAQERAPEPKPRYKVRSRLNRVRIGISLFISSCFSTTRAIVTSIVALVVLAGALLAVGVGAVGLTWIIMEEAPSPVFQSLTTSPQRTLSDSGKNGYLLLLGFDAPAELDPIQAGHERKPDVKDANMSLACLGGSDHGARTGQSSASSSVLSGWFRGQDPVGQFRSHQDAIRGWVSQGGTPLGRYKQWQKLSFEDWGYGQTISPPCPSIMFAHRLYLADGFVQGVDTGVDLLEMDMEAWRIALGQAKTLPVKTLAIQAIHEDIAVASGLLVRPDFDGKYLARVTKMLRPLDQVELSIRWPMQSELVSATKTYEARLKAEREDDQALHAMVASALPLPKQRRFNDYAEYYEASYKAAGEGRYGSLPKWKSYIRFPAVTVMDYLANPIENIVGLEPLAPWDLYNGLVVDTDAHLRLASLQAWLRRGPQDADLLARIAKAGQGFYDPYTGLPMLVNLKKGVMYSVGHDGQDQDADPLSDVVVKIPVAQATTASAKSSSEPFKSR